MEIGTVRQVKLEDQMRVAYLDYAMSVITARALPDVRDGLKPVQRRILYAMDELGLRPNSPYKKSARIVGEVMGKYHPHGDAPVYETMVRMAQTFSMRYVLVDGQGNFGCFTGDTRVRLADGNTRSFEELVADYAKGKVHYTYAVNAVGRIEVAPIRAPRLTKKATPVVRVTLDSGEEIVCTPDHRFMLRDGSYRQAQDLQPSDSLMPLYSRLYDGRDANLHGYEQVYQPVADTWEFAHHLADELNLKSRALKKMWQDPDYRAFQAEAMHAIANRLWADPEHRRRVAESARRHWTEEYRARMARQSAERWPNQEYRAKFAGHSSTNAQRAVRSRFLSIARGNIEAAVQAAQAHTDRLNHRVVSVEPAGFADVYDLTVDEHHNFALAAGVFVHNSVDGDPPAAMRYTEARLAAIAEEMLADIDKNTVDFGPNFDGSLQEPSVLPAKLPNLLVNGSAGIAVGMATNIPPHNLTEVASAIQLMIERYDACVRRGIPFDLVWQRAMNIMPSAEERVAVLKGLSKTLLGELRQSAIGEGGRGASTGRGRREVSELELSDALVEYVDNVVDVTPDQLLECVKGPDFPTGGIILGTEGIKNAVATGHGRVVIRARAHIEEMRGGRYQIIVTELPYQVNKANLLEKIAELVRDRRVEGISELRDESDRQGMRIVIELRRDAQPRLILNQLFKYTAMQTAFSINMLALVDRQPRVLTLKMALLHYINYRKGVITRRIEFELGKARQREHILEGLKIALDHLDAIIQTIRQSPDAEAARNALMMRWKLSELQAQAILDMQLRRLAALERQKILDELAEIKKLIGKLEDLLANPLKILHLVRDDVKHLVEKYGDARRTQIVAKESEDFTDEDLIPNQEMAITLTKRDYVKRMPCEVYRPRGRGAKGAMGTVTREDDAVQHFIAARMHDSVLFFTNQGRVYQLKAHQLPETSVQARGTPLINFVKLQPKETVTAIMSVSDFETGACCVLMTRKGEIKRVSLSDFASVRSNGLIAMDIASDDELAWALLTNGKQDLLVASASGQAIRFSEQDVRTSARGSGGVRAMRLDEDDRVAGAEVIEPGSEILLVSKRGIGKRVAESEFPTHHRGGGGVRALTVTSRSGPLVSARRVRPGDEVMLISREGLVVRTPVDGISRLGRAAQGVTIMNVGRDDAVAAVTLLRGEGMGDGTITTGSNGKGK